RQAWLSQTRPASFMIPRAACARSHPAESPALEVGEGGRDLALAVHYEGAVADHRLGDGLPGEDQRREFSLGRDREFATFAREACDLRRSRRVFTIDDRTAPHR